MSTTHPAPLTAADRSPLHEPGRRLSPRPEDDRPWRIALVLLASAVVALILLALALASTSAWASARGFSPVPATTALGTPASLTVTADVADVQVRASDEVDQVTLALVEDGADELPAPGTEVRARLTQQGGSADPVLDVRQPHRFSTLPWGPGSLDLLLLVPTGHTLSLDLTTEVGGIRAEGDFAALAVRSDVGDIRLTSLSAPGGLVAHSEVGELDIELGAPAAATIDVTAGVGDVALQLPADAGGAVSVTSEVGEIDITAPGSGTWDIDASSELGTTEVDPSLRGTAQDIGSITATSEVGDVHLHR